MKNREIYFIARNIPSRTDLYIHRLQPAYWPEVDLQNTTHEGCKSFSEEILGICVEDLIACRLITIIHDKIYSIGHEKTTDSRTLDETIRPYHLRQIGIVYHHPDYLPDGPTVERYPG